MQLTSKKADLLKKKIKSNGIYGGLTLREYDGFFNVHALA